jgi:hypothetical protein
VAIFAGDLATFAATPLEHCRPHPGWRYGVAIRIGNSGNNILNGTSGSDLLLGSGRSWQIAFHPSRQ